MSGSFDDERTQLVQIWCDAKRPALGEDWGTWRLVPYWDGQMASRTLCRNIWHQLDASTRLTLWGLACIKNDRDLLRGPLAEWRLWHRLHPALRWTAQDVPRLWHTLVAATWPRPTPAPPPGGHVWIREPIPWKLSNPCLSAAYDWASRSHLWWNTALQLQLRVGETLVNQEAAQAWEHYRGICWRALIEAGEAGAWRQGQPATGERDRLLTRLALEANLPVATLKKPARVRL